MALLRQDWGRAGRRKKNTNAAATGRVAARGRTACFTPRRQGKNGRAGGSTGTRRCTAAAHSPQKKTSEEVFLFSTPRQIPKARSCARFETEAPMRDWPEKPYLEPKTSGQTYLAWLTTE